MCQSRKRSPQKVELTVPSFFRAGSPFTPLSPFHIYLCTSFLPCSNSVHPSKSWTSRTVRKIQVSFIYHPCACSLWSSLLTSRFMSSVAGIVRQQRSMLELFYCVIVKLLRNNCLFTLNFSQLICTTFI